MSPNPHRARFVVIPAVLVALLTACGGSAAPQSSGGAPVSSAATASQSPSASVASAKASAAPVKIGFITPLSGPVSAYGALLKHAPVLVTKAVNQSGGINGSPLEVVTFDSPNNPQETTVGLRRLANEDKVFAVVGPYFTGEAEVAAPLADQLNIVDINSSTKPGIVDGRHWAFRLNNPDDQNLPPAVEAFKKTYPNVHKMIIVGDAKTAVTAAMIKDIWPKVLPKYGYQILDTVTFDFSTTDFSPIATRIQASGAEGIALSALTPAAPNLLRELQKLGLKLPVVSSAHLQTVPIFPKIAGPAADGLIEPFFFNPDRAKEPKVRDWLAAYQAAAEAGSSGGQKPVIGFAGEPHYYDIFNILVKIMRDAGINGSTPLPEAREKIRAGLEKVKDYDGIAGTLSTSSNHDITWQTTALIARNGQWETVK